MKSKLIFLSFCLSFFLISCEFDSGDEIVIQEQSPSEIQNIIEDGDGIPLETCDPHIPGLTN